MDEDIEWLGGGEGESDPGKWFEGSARKAEAWLDSNQEEDKEVEWLESTKKADEDKDEVEWLGSTKKPSEEQEQEGGGEQSCSNDGWFLATSKEVEGGDSHMGGQWFEASVEDLGQLEIFDLPPALNVHVQVTSGELASYYQLGRVDGMDKILWRAKVSLPLFGKYQLSVASS